MNKIITKKKESNIQTLKPTIVTIVKYDHKRDGHMELSPSNIVSDLSQPNARSSNIFALAWYTSRSKK